MRFVVVTGMSGGGKRTALKMLEDAGFYCVDNLPVALIGKFIELLNTPNLEISKVALGLDVRADQTLDDIGKTLDSLKKTGFNFELLFMEACDEVLLNRYKESRRMHPLSNGEGVADGVERERKLLEPFKKKADYVFDTSHLLTRDLKKEMERIFVNQEEYNSLIINVISFGFKYGIPADADLVFDVRFLPNPYYSEELRPQTGNDKPVQDFVLSFQESIDFLDKLTDMIEFLIPNYVKEGKYQLVIAIGCTGGQHRSVTLANELYARLKKKRNYGLTIRHRDI